MPAKKKKEAKVKVTKQYKAARGAGFNDEQAQVIGEVLEDMGDEVTPEQILKEARRKSSPIHEYFEWDDNEAATKYREYQARNLVNHLNVVIIVDDEEQETKAFHSISIEVVSEEGEPHKARSYRPLNVVIKDDDLKQKAIEAAMRELRSWQRRYAQYRQIFPDVFVAIDQVA